MSVTAGLIARTYLLRGTILWFLARTVSSTVMLLAHANASASSTRTSVVIIFVATILGLAQTARLREGVLLGNLGVSRPELAAFFALPALAGELLIATTYALLA